MKWIYAIVAVVFIVAATSLNQVRLQIMVSSFGIAGFIMAASEEVIERINKK